jgi:thiamine-phosphate pyrophosphorylase
MRPVICLITDGRLGAGREADALVESVGAAARAGVDLIHVRERRVDDLVLAEVVGRCVRAVRGTRARVLVNDRLDVALAGGAHGVHLRSDSYPAARARTLTAAGFLVGRSVHSVEDAVRASVDDSVNYLIFGTVFATSSKPGHVPAGLAALAETVRVTPVPVLAVGGVTAGNAPLVARAGAAGVAAIALFADGALPLPSSIERLASAFDTLESGS